MELESVVAALAKDVGLSAKGRILVSKTNSLVDPYSSSVMVMAKSDAKLAAFTDELGWKPAQDNGVSVWTDDYSNIPAAIWRKYMGHKN